MIVEGPLRTRDLARAAQISVQQVRNYEADGLIPRAERSANGYRQFGRRHLLALTTVRQLIGGYGLSRTRGIMQAVHEGRRADALAIIDERHAELAATRAQIEHTLVALGTLAAQWPADRHPRYSERVRVGAAAREAGVRISALRFWEQQGLLEPIRDKDNRYRLYDERQRRRLRIVTLLRQANHDFDAIRATLAEVEAGQPEDVVTAIEKRRRDVADLSWRCVGALAGLHGYLSAYPTDPA